jgi:hypothetical protein
MDSRFKWFFSALMLTTLLPFITYIFPFLPGQLFGFNLTGWAWIIMLLVTIINLFFSKEVNFPVFFWLPWMLYLIGYLIIDFSFIGLQLTLQYVLPVLIGIVASGFTYSDEDLHWLFKWFMRLCLLVFAMFIFGQLFRGGYTPDSAATPMLFSISMSLVCALYFTTRITRYLIFAGIIFLVPVIDVTRMGIAAMAAVFILHFANNDIINKFKYGIMGVFVMLLVFNSRGFQEKTFYDGEGSLSDLAFNYYENPEINSSGRSSWKMVLQPGLEAAPVWGNGPRSDNQVLTIISGLSAGEAHNDYLSVRYNYGWVGLGLLLAGFITSFISIYRISREIIDNISLWIVTTATLSLFFSFLLFMYSDNILKYTIYFPNYFFALIGIIYTIKKDEDISSNPSL